MRLPWSREAVPQSVRDAVPLAPGERVLAAAKGGPDRDDPDQWHLVATDRALYVVAADGQVRRIRWDLIDRALWQPPRLLLELRAAETAPATREHLQVDQTGDLPAVVRDRVENSIVVNSRIEVAGGYARVLARRNSDTKLLGWRVVFSPGVDPQDPAAQEAARRELAELRSRLGV